MQNTIAKEKANAEKKTQRLSKMKHNRKRENPKTKEKTQHNKQNGSDTVFILFFFLNQINYTHNRRQIVPHTMTEKRRDKRIG